MKQKIFLAIGILILIVCGYEIFSAYMANHLYYYDPVNGSGMITQAGNWWLVILSLLIAALPVAYIVRAKKVRLSWILYILGLSVVLFAFAHIGMKDQVTNSFMLVLNNILLYVLGIYILVGILSIGVWIRNKYIKFHEDNIVQMLLTFGIGLIVFLFMIYVLLFLNIFFPVLIRAIFIGMGVLVYIQRISLQKYLHMIEEVLGDFSLKSLKGKNIWNWFGVALLVFSIAYYLFGFQLSFIPYSTAWDANHAYMYFPKIWADNFGVFWKDAPIVFPHFWTGYIAFFFALIKPLSSWFWLSPDNVAVSMNFLSAILVLVFGLATIKAVIQYFGKFINKTLFADTTIQQVVFYLGRFILLLWLASGMGAFLVFIDNKTDLGVMAMTILAILSGFMFIHHASFDGLAKKITKKELMNYVYTSGLLFTGALLSKPTAFVDVALFGLLLVALWLGNWLTVGLGLMIIGFFGKVEVQTSSLFIDSQLGNIFLGLGLLAIILQCLMRFKAGFSKTRKAKKSYVTYIIARFLTIAISLVIIKGPYTLVSRSLNNIPLGPKDTFKAFLLSDANNNIQKLLAQNTVDIQAITASSPEQCSLDALGITREDLYKNLRKPPEEKAGGADLGRYIGYGWREFTHPSLWSDDEKQRYGFVTVGYRLLRILFPFDDRCYALDSSAKILCANATAVASFDIPVLRQLHEQMKSGSKGHVLLGEILADPAIVAIQQGDAYNAQQFRPYISELTLFYQNASIQTWADKIAVPYRYLVPFNIVFNWSLQNLSSYYTDIGFIWLIIFILLVSAYIYSLLYKDTKLSSLALVTCIGWAIWWVIGSAIVWYGVGLIMWTTATLVIFFKRLFEHSHDDKEIKLLYVFVGIFVVWGVIQTGLNFVRISTQGATGPFMRYKMYTAHADMYITENLVQTTKINRRFGKQNVFDMQFGHYNKFINHVKDRPNEDGVHIAGTYLQYFLHNQHNIKGRDLWELTSDNNTCKSYLRFIDDNLKYIVLDPNILSIVMGEGNSHLYDTFFAKLDPVTKRIQEYGILTMMVKMRQEGYISLFSTNNLGAKYAFLLPDDAFRAVFGAQLSDDEIVLLRAKLVVARFFPAESQALIGFVANTFTQRMMNGEAIGDIADVYGRQVDAQKILQIAQQQMQQTAGLTDAIQQQIEQLDQGERLILAQYLGLYNLLRSQQMDQYQSHVSNILMQSVGGSSQLVIFERK